MNWEMISQTLEGRRDELRRFGVKKLGLFGSCVRGEANSQSDLDFIVDFDQESFDAYMGLKFFLEDTFGADVDLVMTQSIKPRLRDVILSEARYVPGL